MKPLRATMYASALSITLLSTTLLSTTLVASTLLLSGCSEGDLPPPISTAGMGGEAGSGGMPSGNGGTSAQGGGGAAGGGGSGGAEPYVPTMTLSFGAGLEGFGVNYACTPTPPCAAVMPPVADETSSNFFAVAHDTDVGFPDPGSARVTVQFSGGGQSLNFARNIAPPGVDLVGKVLTVRALVDAGAPPTTAKLYVKTTDPTYAYADSGQVTLVPGTWATLTYRTDGPPAYIDPVNQAVFDLAKTVEIGLEIAAAATTLTPATLHIDTLEY